jgi:hypothetical protein
VQFTRDVKKRNCFHVAVEEQQNNVEMATLLEALVDSRLVHLISDNTTNVKSAGRFVAYLVDVGLYGYPERRGDRAVEEVKFWEKDSSGRLKNLERSPVYRMRDATKLREAEQQQNGEEAVTNRIFATGEDSPGGIPDIPEPILPFPENNGSE